MNVLFLCTGNSCRSILAEATFNHLAPEGWHGMSAGSHPTGQVHPRSLALLAREGIATEGYYSKSWENLPWNRISSSASVAMLPMKPVRPIWVPCCEPIGELRILLMSQGRMRRSMRHLLRHIPFCVRVLRHFLRFHWKNCSRIKPC